MIIQEHHDSIKSTNLHGSTQEPKLVNYLICITKDPSTHLTLGNLRFMKNNFQKQESIQ